MFPVPLTFGAMRHVTPSLIGLALVSLPLESRAQVGGDQANAAMSAAKAGMKLAPNRFGGSVMFGLLDDDLYATMMLRLNLDRDFWGVGFGVPIRLRLLDLDPKDGGAAVKIRSEDWDEFADFLRVLRYVYVGQADKKGLFYVRLGELSGLTIGHGTIVSRYSNGFDIDRWRLGTNAVVNIDAYGGEAVIADLARPVDSTLWGFRFNLRPIQIALGEGFWRKLVVGASMFFDPAAPYELETETIQTATGTVTQVKLDDKNHQIVKTRKPVFMLGLDAGIELLESGPLQITPYIDLNKLTYVDGGWGLHLGILWSLKVPALIDDFVVDLRTEYRRVSQDYLGPYFDAVYEIQRYEFPPGSKQPKLAALSDPARVHGNNGVYFDVLAGFPTLVYIGGQFIDYDGGKDDGTLTLSLEIPALEFIRLSAFYYRLNIKDLGDLFALDDRSAIVAEVSIPIYAVISLNARWWRVWQADPDNAGSYTSVDDWSVGLGVAFEF